MANYDELTARLYESGHKYRKELLAMPLAQLNTLLQHMTLRLGIRGKESVGELDTDAELRPFTGEKNATDATDIQLRTLETFHGSVVKEFIPSHLSSTVYGNAVSTTPTETDIVRAIAMLMAQKASNKLRTNLFTAVRKPTGTTTADLFDGFATIIGKEKTAGNLSSAKGNLTAIGELTRANIVDKLMEYYQDATCEELQEQNTKMWLPTNLYNLYMKGYQDDFGSSPFNREYKKTFLEGTDDRCELVPFSGLRGTGLTLITVKRNMLIGADQMSDAENVRIRPCDNPFTVQFVMELYFGVQIESLSKQVLNVGEFTLPSGTAAEPSENPGSQEDPEGTETGA